MVRDFKALAKELEFKKFEWFANKASYVNWAAMHFKHDMRFSCSTNTFGHYWWCQTCGCWAVYDNEPILETAPW